MSKRILFVDDDSMILEAIQHSLRSMRAEWDVKFANSGAEALETMAQTPFDIVVTDMRMPGMDGAQLLESVKAKYPRTVRIILSGQSDRETILRSIGPSHQYLAKPCDVDELKASLNRAFALRDMLENPRVKEIFSRLKSVPSLPALYSAVAEALRFPETSLKQIGDLIAQDMGMCAKVLQLVNSAFFGLACRVSSPHEAIAMIGFESLKALVLSVEVFSAFGEEPMPELSFLWKHSIATACFAKAIATVQKSSRETVDDAFTAGLLHDIGRLVLASVFQDEYREVLRRAAEPGVALATCEAEAFGCSHNVAGAYLLGLWGLADPVVEAVAWHHQPAHAEPTSFSALIAVHVADYYENQRHPDHRSGGNSVIDEPLLSRLGLQTRIASWSKACQEVILRSETHA